MSDLLDRLEAQLVEAAARTPRRRPPASALLMAAVVLLVLVIGGGFLVLVHPDASPTPARRAASRPAPVPPPARSTGPTSATGTTDPASFPTQQLSLCGRPGVGAHALGVIQLSGGTLALQATGLPKDNRYLIWFYDSAKRAVPLGFAQYDNRTRRLAGGVQGLPRQAMAYRYLVLTRETGRQISGANDVVMKSTPITTSGTVGEEPVC